jgi:cytochrome b6-f complex iron-sulfur subunit
MENSIVDSLRPGWRWLLAIGLGVPLLLGVVLALGALLSWLSDGYEPPKTLDSGLVSEFNVGAPKLYEEEDIWLVRVSEGEFLALYDRGVESGCPLQWRREFEFMSRRGWFVDACTGSAYDLTGRCASQVCNGALLDRFAVQVQDGNVIVELDQVLRDPAASQPTG